MKANCPLLSTLVPAPATTTLMITDGCMGRVETSKARGLSFQPSTEEARAAASVVTGMYAFIFVQLFHVCLCL